LPRGVVTGQGLEEAQSKSAGRRIPLQAGLYKSGAYASEELRGSPHPDWTPKSFLISTTIGSIINTIVGGITNG
jgi:hypothetical protein